VQSAAISRFCLTAAQGSGRLSGGALMTNHLYRRDVRGLRGLAFGVSAGALVAGLGMVALPTAALAQAADQQSADAPAADDNNGGEIIVTGIRASLANSARIKRESTLIVESVSAEDIGKLPDVSIADSLARLPGVTAQRLEGRDQRLSIRGLGPDFGTTLLNGREQVTVGDNRGVEYDQYPAEFFRNVNVYKSADASLIAAGISGTVDLRMLRPLDQKGRILSVAGRGQLNDIKALNPDGTRYGYRAAATYVDKFLDDTLGIAVGFSATSSPSQDERYNAWGYANDANGNLILGGAKPYVQSNLLERYGAIGTIEWQPSEKFHLTFDALYSNFTETQRLRGIELPLAFNTNNTPGSLQATQSNITTSNGFDTQATFGNVFAVQRNDLNRRTADNFSLGLNAEYKFNDKIKLTLDGSWSRATRTDFLLETYTGTGYQRTGTPDRVTVTAQPNGTFRIVPTLDYTNTNIFRITDPQGWGYNGTTPVVQAGFLNRPSFTDDLKSLRANLNGEIDASILKSWEVGFNYTRRKKVSAYTSFFLCPVGAGTNCTVASGTPTSAPVPSAALLGQNVSLAYLGVPAMLTLNPEYIYANSLRSVFDNRPGSLVRDNSVTEDVITAYAKLNIDGTLGGKPLKGAIGIQAINTRQGSTGTISNFTVTNGVGNVTILPVSGSVNYWHFLPSLTMSVELVPNTFVKIGASQTIVRPRLDQERINQEFNVNLTNIGNPVALNSPFSSNGGNVNLRPYKSDNIDLSIEKYFTGGGYFALAGYFKHLSSFVQPGRSIPYDFSAALGQLPPAAQQIVRANGWTVGLLTAPDNSGRGEILGAEATLSLPFKALTEALDGFGIFTTAAYNLTSVKYAGTPGSIPLPGQSDFTTSNTFYYENHGFQARVNYRYRSGFLAEVAGLSANPTYRQASDEGILDVQVGYDFKNGPLAGLSILAQVKNLTDTPFITYQNNDRRQVIDYQRYGRDYYLGFIYKF